MPAQGGGAAQDDGRERPALLGGQRMDGLQARPVPADNVGQISPPIRPALAGAQGPEIRIETIS
jgi:hypothetical protein